MSRVRYWSCAHVRTHAQQTVHRGDFVVGQPRRHRRIAIHPLLADLNPVVVISLQASQTAAIYALQGQRHRCLRIPEPCNAILHNLASRAADQDARCPHPGPVLIPSEVEETGLPRSELEEGQDLVGFLQLAGNGPTCPAATGQQARLDSEGVDFEDATSTPSISRSKLTPR